MRKTIYCKYANDRNVNLKIRTTIYEEADGTRSVCKEGLTEHARAHIRHMHMVGQKIEEQCKNSCFTLNKGTLVGDVLELEYLQGDTLEQRLDCCLAQMDYDGFRTIVLSYAKELRGLATEQFAPTAAYTAVFGADAFCDGEAYSLKQSDIDMIFANIMCVDEKFVILDYEWVFDFLIPVDYILYRTALYYTSSRHQALEGGALDLYELFQLDMAKLDCYDAMEQAFQSYITKNNTPLWKLYDTIGKDVLFPAEACEHYQGQKKVELVCYYGEELVSARQTVVRDRDNRIRVTVAVKQGITALRIDPCDASCLIAIDKIYWNEDENNTIGYGINGASTDNRFAVVDHTDAQILIGELDKITDLQTITVCYYIDTIHKSLADALTQLMQQYNEERFEGVNRVLKIQELDHLLSEQKQINEEQKNKNEELKNKNEEQANLIAAMQQSISWKITKPLRAIRKIRR